MLGSGRMKESGAPLLKEVEAGKGLHPGMTGQVVAWASKVLSPLE